MCRTMKQADGSRIRRPVWGMLRLEHLIDIKVEKWMGFTGLEFRGKVQAREIL